MASSKENFQAAVTLAQKLTKELVEMGEAASIAFEGVGDPKTLKDIEATEKAIEDLSASTKLLANNRKSQATADAKLRSLRKGEQDELIKTRTEVQKETKAVKDRIKASNSLTPLLDKERKRLALMQKQLAETALRTGASSRETRKLAKSTQFLNEKILRAEKLGGKFQGQVGKYPQIVGKGIIAFAGIGAGIELFRRGIGAAINIAKDFEQSNANLAAVLGTTKENIGALTEDAKRLGAATSFSASQVSELQTEFAKLGFNEQEILNATEATLNLAAATGSELGEAAAIAGATLGGFGLGAEETGRVTDVMAKSFSTSALDIEKFKESMKTAAPAARAVGKTVEETTALLGTLANAGISGSKAGTGLKTSFINLNAAGLTMNEGFEKVNKSSDKLGTAVKLVGKEAAAAFLVLAEGQETTKELEIGLNNAGGAAERMAKEQLNTLEGSLKILNSAWEGFVLGLLSGEGAFSSISRGVVEATTSLLSLLTTTEGINKEWLNQRENIKSLNDEILENSDRYDELKEKTELTKDEQIELDAIIQKLAEDVPTAITAFDEYGKALDITTTATRKFAEQQKNLLLVTNAEEISKTEKALTTLNNQLERQNDLFKESGQGLQVYDRELEKATNGSVRFRDATAEEIAEFVKRKSSIQDLIDGNTAYLAQLKGEKTAAEEAAEEERKLNEENKESITTLNTLNAELSELKKLRGDINIVDREALAINKQSIKALQAEIDLIEGKIKKQKESNALLNDEKRRISIIQDESLKAFEAEELRFNETLKKAKENGENLELVELEHLQNLEDLRKKFHEADIEIFREASESRRKLNTTSGNDLLKQEKEEAARLKKIEDERLRREKELTDAAITIVETGLKKRSDAKLKALDEDLKASEGQRDKLEDLAARGSSDALASLALAQKAEAEIRKEQEKEIQRQKQIEAGLTAFKVFAAKTEAGDKNALGSTIADMTVLQTFINSLPSAFDGTIDTGQGGDFDNKKGFLAINHPKERIVPKSINDKMGGMSNELLGDIAQRYNKGILMEHKDLTVSNNVVERFQSNEDLIAKYDEMIGEIKSLPSKMPVSTGHYSAFQQALVEVQKRGNVKTTTINSIID